MSEQFGSFGCAAWTPARQSRWNMTRMIRENRTAKTTIVIGGGAVGLSCAWSLQQQGIDVEVVDSHAPGSGASWGNAGYLTPSLAAPLPEPSLLRYGLRSVLNRNSPVCLPIHVNIALVRFMSRMMRNCTSDRWRQAMSVYRYLNARAFDAFDAQEAAGVSVSATDAHVLAGFEHAGQAAGLLCELQAIAECGQAVQVEMLTADQAHELEPSLSANVRSAVQVLHQRYLDPIAYVASLADQVRARGGKITENTQVTAVRRRAGRVIVESAGGDRDADAVVVAAGAWLPSLARAHGVRIPMYAGRGYSFTVRSDRPLRQPVYFPAARIAVTPRGKRIKVAGIMEFQQPDALLNRRRIATMVRATSGLLDGVDWDGREDEWVGPRPLTADGLPLVGSARTPGVFIAGGLGMWGITLGPIAGQLVAEQIATGRTAPEMKALEPCR